MWQIQLTVSENCEVVHQGLCVCALHCNKSYKSLLSVRIDGLKSLSHTQIQPYSQFQSLDRQSNPWSLKQTEQTPPVTGRGWDFTQTHMHPFTRI